MEEHLTPRQVAEALRVSESSVKRWCDSGAIPTIRTIGGHRRVPLEALLEFLDRTNRQLLNPTAVGISVPKSPQAAEQIQKQVALDEQSIEELRTEFLRSMIAGDAKNCRRILLDGYSLCRAFAPLADRIIAEAFREIGNRWACNELEVYQERRSCEICSQLIHEFRRLIAEPASDAPIAIGGSPSSDPYTLPSQVIELVLRESGWQATNLGANLPFETLLAAAVEYRPKLFWISASQIENEEKFIEEFQHFSHNLPRDVVLVVGGRALHDILRPRLKFTAHCDSMTQLLEFSRAVRGFRPSFEASEN